MPSQCRGGGGGGMAALILLRAFLMLRLTPYLASLLPLRRWRWRAAGRAGGDLNLIRRCNLTCQHCYSISADRDFPVN